MNRKQIALTDVSACSPPRETMVWLHSKDSLFPGNLEDYVMPLLQKLKLHLNQPGELKLIYVLDLKREMVCADYEVVIQNQVFKLHHTQLTSFDENRQLYTPVLCAGEMLWHVQDGCATLVQVNNQSGRFRPSSDAMMAVRLYLETLRAVPWISIPKS